MKHSDHRRGLVPACGYSMCGWDDQHPHPSSSTEGFMGFSGVSQRGFSITVTIVLTGMMSCFCVTDEAPSTCNVFLTEGGLELFMKLLQLTDGEETDNHVQVETKILGLLVISLYHFEAIGIYWLVWIVCLLAPQWQQSLCTVLRYLHVCSVGGVCSTFNGVLGQWRGL